MQGKTPFARFQIPSTHKLSSRPVAWAIAAICLVRLGAFGCFFDSSGSIGIDGSVMHELFPEVYEVTGIALPDGTIGGLAYGDFDCDGEQDLAIGDPDQSVNSLENAGVVHLYYANGDTKKLYQAMLDNTPTQSGAAFGFAMAAANFNGTGCDDLAVGAPGFGSTGRVHIVRGYNSFGLYAGDNQVLDGIQTGEAYGTALAAGYFNADERADLAVGIPRKTVDSAPDAGSVEVFYGGLDGFATSVFFSQDHWYLSNIEGTPEASDFFGFSVAAGDFDGNGIDDLVVGVPGECGETALGVCQAPGLPDGERGGAVNVFYGVADGLQVSQIPDELWSQRSPGVKGKIEDGDGFGFSVATGDFNADGYADLAIGVPGENIDDDSIVDAGSVNVLYGSRNGLQSDGRDGSPQDQIWDLDCTNLNTCGAHDITGNAGAGFNFGIALATGDFDADGRSDDLAVGSPTYVHFGSNGGAVSLILGTGTGLNTPGSALWHQNSSGVADAPDGGDFFGAALAVRRGQGGDQLAVRVNDGDPCAVNVLLGSGAGDFFLCSSDGVPLFESPHTLVDPGGEFYDEPGPFEDPLPGTFTYGGGQVAVDPSTVDDPIHLAATPTVVRPGETIAVSWEATADSGGSGNEIGGATVGLAPAQPATTTLFSALSPSTQLFTTFTTSGVIGSVGGSPGGGGPGGGEVAPVEPSVLDWVGMFRPAAANTENVEWHYTDALYNGFLLFTAPSEVGEFEFRYLLDGGAEDVAVSNPVLVVPAMSLSASPATATAGQLVDVCWELTDGQPFSDRDWLGMYAFGAPSEGSEDWSYTGGVDSGCITFPAPAVESRTRYQFRYLLDDGYQDIAGVDVSVDPAPSRPRCGLGSHLVLVLPGLLWLGATRRRRC